MKTPAEYLASLEASAQSWVGTPFCERSAVKGAGVCCHLAVGRVYQESGLLPADADIPSGPPQWSRFEGRSLMEEWLDQGSGRHWFVERLTTEMQPGDLLGFRIGHCIHHLGIVLPGGRVFHAVERLGAIISPNLPPAWRKRLTRLWRPTLLLNV